MDPKKQYYANLAATIIKNLNHRRMEGYYCNDKTEALQKALSMISEGDVVSFGGSVTLNEIGLLDALKERTDIRLLDRYSVPPEEENRILREAISSDTYFMSTNAITIDGELVNIDGRGNRIAALSFGPGSVIIIAGMNKVAPDLPSALARAKELAAAPNAIRLNLGTPCTITGRCGNCIGDKSICSNTIVTRRSHYANRIKVILVGEELGY